jgi:hypothetical protein
MSIIKFDDFQIYEAEKPKNESHLFFNGNKLDFIEGGKVTKSWKAVSGRTYYHWYIKPEIWKRRYTLKPEAWAKYKNEGPTPPGNYTLGETQHRTSNSKWETDANYVKQVVTKQTVTGLPGSSVKDEPHEFKNNTPTSAVAWGDYRWLLVPKKGTQTFGRDRFYLHGGSTPGSIGCIDLVTESDDFAKYYAAWQARTGNSTISVIIDYKTFVPSASLDATSQPYKMAANTGSSNSNKWYADTDKIISDTIAKNKIPLKSDILKSRRS